MSLSVDSKNASPSNFGWDFQVNAGIVLMLMNIRDATSVKIEGYTEDVEVALADNTKIYAQAKGVFDTDDTSNVIAKLTAALGTLNNAASQPNAGKLVYVTNSPNPFNNASSTSAFSGATAFLKYAELPQTCRTKIDTICSTKGHTFSKDKLAVIVFDFHGDGENRYRIVKEKVNELLASLNLSDRGWGQNSLEVWQREFGRNASEHDRTRNISKKQMIWPLIVWLCDVGRDDARLSDCDEAEVSEILNGYRTVICDAVERFEFVAKVMTEHSLFEPSLPSSGERTRKFVAEKWADFKSDFSLPSVPDISVEQVVKISINNVIRSRFAIDKIKRGVNL